MPSFMSELNSVKIMSLECLKARREVSLKADTKYRQLTNEYSGWYSNWV